MRNKTQHGRRKFLKSAAVAGGAATVAFGTQAVLAETPEPVQAVDTASKGYHTTPHIEEYYRLARD